jgi:DNA-binding SARP family transcriptional activator
MPSRTSAHEAAFTLQLFGWWRLTTHSAAVSLGSREQRLSAFVALRGTRSRAHVAGVLWPDTDDEHARTSLRAAIRQINQRAEGLLEVTRAVVGLGPAVRVDVIDYVENVRRAEDGGDEAAVTALLGDHELLPGWYDDWVSLEREHLHLTRLRTLVRLAVTALERGDLEGAERLAVDAIRIEPLHEPAHSVLIRARLVEGDPAGAVRLYQRLGQALSRELGIAPSPPLQELMRPLVNAVPHPRPRMERPRDPVVRQARLG